MFDELDQKFKAGISETFGEIVAASKKWDVDLGTAAYMLAIENQAKHHLKKGLRP
jgi:glutamate dehydrogenase/leucine dehydrogenase